MSALLESLSQIVGARQVLTAEADMAPHLKEWRNLFKGRASAVVKPASTGEVAAILSLAHQTGTPIVPQGGNTGLVGGQIPVAEGREIILSLARMDKVRAVEPSSDTIIVEAGVTLQRVQEAADAAGRLFPLSLASEGSCTIGGNLSTNAGGTAVIAYGNARDLCLGLEVVLADGRIWNGLRTLRKDNTGYDLKNLFIGAEGTLGIITAASLKLFPRPQSRATAFLAVPDPGRALALLNLVKAEAGPALTTFELMPRFGLEVVVRHAAGARDPLSAPSPWMVLMELSSPRAAGLDATLETLLETALEQGLVTDAAIAASEAQRRALWRIREAMSEVQGYEGGSIKHDVSVPVASVPAFLARGIALVEAMAPGCRPLPFGHLGDGNIHFNVSQPVGADKEAFLALWGDMNEAVHGLVREFGGSISAEHGIGRLKRHLLASVKDPVELAMMRAIKATLDPSGILNPGSVL
ncbi:MAG: FAD-binding oxidoreductase [Bosea sp.]|jgi:FAD/FMN-containing dehydrogenase|nr:FAD-binding oxidoreductase [Bosea sp. (in: a-proteobacteria)]